MARLKVDEITEGTERQEVRIQATSETREVRVETRNERRLDKANIILRCEKDEAMERREYREATREM